MPYYVYILHCADDTYYTGMAHDLSRRLIEHESGADSKSYTYSRRPVSLAWCEEFPTHDDAFQREHQIKGWSRKKKEALIQDNFQAIQEIVREEKRKRGLTI